MRILAIDMGRSKCVACDYVRESGEHGFEALLTTPEAFHDLIVARSPDVVAIEICPAAGWVRDLCEVLQVKLVVANTSDEPWRWQKLKRKSDRDDALKLAKLMALNQVRPVHIPELPVRQWRMLITYRHTLVAEVTAIRNRIRSILDQMATSLAVGAKAFGGEGRQAWESGYSRPLEQCEQRELWQGMIHLELERMDGLARQIAQVNLKLRQLASQDDRVARLKTAPGVGDRTAELVVALVDQPERFGRGKQLGSYAGLTPRKYQSGQMDHAGRISRAGCGLLRAMLVEASWIAIRTSKQLLQVYERVRRGSNQRKKKAIVAVARRLLVRLWAMLRDKTVWRDPPVAQVAAA
jgi:transposase